MVDNLGAMRTDIVREVTSGDTKETIKVAIINVYVPTGVNKLAAERERVMEHRIMGAVKHVMEGMENIIVTGDWNHLTNRWSLYLFCIFTVHPCGCGTRAAGYD